MPSPVKITRRPTAGGAGAPSSLLSGQLAFNENTNILYYGTGDAGGGVASSIIQIGGSGATGTWNISTTGNAATATTWQTGRTISLTGDVTGTSVAFNGSANLSFTATLANSGVTAGTYNNSATQNIPLTIDAKGRVTSIGAGVTITPAWASITSKPTTLSGFGITDALPISGGTLTGALNINYASNAGLSIGRVDGVTSTPFIDFNSGATVVDYDSRIIAGGGTGSIGGGSLTLIASQTIISSELNIGSSPANRFIDLNLDDGTTNYTAFIRTTQNDTLHENAISIVRDGAVSLFFDNSSKLATTSTGIDVTGVITSDGLDTTGNINLSGTAKLLIPASSGTIGGSNFNQGWLQIGDGVSTGISMDPNELYFVGSGNIGALPGGTVTFAQGFVGFNEPIVLGSSATIADRGPVTAFSTTPASGGSGYPDGIYTALTLSGGTGTAARATVSIGGGSIVSVEATPVMEGRAYTAGDVLSVASITNNILPTTSASGNGTTATLGYSAQSVLATTAASGTGTTATLTFAAQTLPPYPVGSRITVSGVTPAGYNGTFVVTACTTTTVSYANATTGAQTVAGTISLIPYVVGASIQVTGVTPTGYNGTYTVTASTATTVSYANATTGAQTVAGTISFGTQTSNATITVSTVRAAGINIVGGPTSTVPTRIRLENVATSLSSGNELGTILFSTRDASTGGQGDKVWIQAVAEGTSGGGQLRIYTSANGQEPSLGFAFGGNNDFRLFNSSGTFYHTFSNSPTANRTITLPDANVTLVSGTMFPTSGGTITGTVTAQSFIPTSSTIPTAGMYLPTGTSLGFTIQSTQILSLSPAGGTLTGDLTLTGSLSTGNITTSSTTFSIAQANATTVNAFTAGTLINIGGGSITSGTKTLNIGTNGSTGSTTAINIGTSTVSPVITIGTNNAGSSITLNAANNVISGPTRLGSSGTATTPLHLAITNSNTLQILAQLQNRDSGASSGAGIAFITSTNDFADNRYSYIASVSTGSAQNGNNIVIAPNANGSPAAVVATFLSSGLNLTGNTKIGGTANRGTTEGNGQLVLFNGTAPVGTLTNGVSLYSSSGELLAMDSSGTVSNLTAPFTSTVQGIVPASGGGTTNFLRADGTWAAPAGGGGGSGDVVGPASATDNAIARYDLTTGKLIQNSGILISDTNVLSPATSNSGSLGSTTLQWSDLFLAEGGVINWDNGDVTLTQSGDTLTVSGGNLICTSFIEANVGVEITSTATPATPATDKIRVFNRKIAGRNLPAFVGPSGLDSSLQPILARNGVAMWWPTGNGTGVTLLGTTALTVLGTATTANVAVTNALTRQKRVEWLVTTAATTAIASFRNTLTQWTVGGTTGGFFFVCRWAPSTGLTNSSHRAFCGMGLNAAPTDVNPSTRLNNVGMGWDSADTNVQIMHNDGTGTATKIDLGASLPKPSTDRSVAYELALFSPPGASSIVHYEVTELISGNVVTGTITTDLPSNTTLLAPIAYTSVGGVSSVTGLALCKLYIESDY